MNKTYNSINPSKTNQFIITWDTGRRCNFDCAYCGDDRHDLVSKFPDFDELVKGVDFIKEYLRTIMPYRNEQTASVSLTGGEPTANPNFMRLSSYLKEAFADFEYDVFTILTTNGSFPAKNIPQLAQDFRGITLSYHCDSNEKIKAKVRENILILKNSMKSFKVNLMMHPYDDYWQECLDLIDVMDEHKVKYVPRIINGLEYSPEQSDFLKNYWQRKNKTKTEIKVEEVKKEPVKKEKEIHRKMKKDVEKTFKELKKDTTKTNIIHGRHCCSKHELSCGLTCGDKQDLTYVSDTRFPEWYCGVNWFFLHLESQTDQIFHHQTCQAQFGKGRGPVGTISNWQAFNNRVKTMLETGTMETIQCPNKKCGCGLCATKAIDKSEFYKLISNHVKGVEYEPA